MKIAILTINQPSLDSAQRLLSYLGDHDVDIYGKEGLTHTLSFLHTYQKLDDILPDAWETYDAIICILAMGAVVRKIAPLLKDKSTDPAVIVINLGLDRVVPLLSGHLGGANALADEIASALPSCINFISTATDQTRTLAFEMLAKERGWQIRNLKALARISNRLINKQTVKVATYRSLFETIPDRTNLILSDFSHIDEDTVVIAAHIHTEHLTLMPPVTLGIGCNRGTGQEMIEEAFQTFLTQHNLTPSQIGAIASFDAKKDEKGLLAFAKAHHLPVTFFDKESINALEQTFSHSASTKFFGLKGVAEPSAVLGSHYKELIIKKSVYHKAITIAGAI